MNFKISCNMNFNCEQKKSVESIVEGIKSNLREQTLMGVTGSGKTFIMAGVIEKINKPTLVIAHNKTLASQLCVEFKSFFPNNAVEYFVSYYDYYRPEAYIADTNTYIEKDSSINSEIDKLRHSATSSLSERNDVIVVSSVSCIYNLGNPIDYKKMVISIRPGMQKNRNEFIKKLIELQYKRSDCFFDRGYFRVRGDIIDIFPVESSTKSIRVELFGDEVESIIEINPLTGEPGFHLKHISIYPATHYIVPKEKINIATEKIINEMEEREEYFKKNNKLIEAQRIRERTLYDIEMLREIGFCKGIENYSKILSGGISGEPPFTLFDFFPKDYLLFIDESHVTLPQIGAMHLGDKSRKNSLVENGFRLPSSYDNRPLTSDEFYVRINKVIFVSATPGDFEINKSQKITEQIIRPTGLIDPKIKIMPIDINSELPKYGIDIKDEYFINSYDEDIFFNKIIENKENIKLLDSEKYDGQISDLIKRINERTEKNERVLITTLTKKMAESLTDHLEKKDIKVCYMHSDTDTIERMEIIQKLRLGIFDVLVGINLLREGLDIPEVSLVAILDADKMGFLRSHRSLIQIIGRAARNSSGEVIMYSDRVTKSMIMAIKETYRRRKIQLEFNKKNNIIPKTIKKDISEIIKISIKNKSKNKKISKTEKEKIINSLTKKMINASELLDFETAAYLRDEINKINKNNN